ncbi:hypothetical protein M758_4G206500, partial [Ceratodon purpureus]
GSVFQGNLYNFCQDSCTNAIKSFQGAGILQHITPTFIACSRNSIIPLRSFSGLFLLPSYTMKLHVTAAAAVCLVMLLVTSEMVVTSEAAGCDIFQLVPCMAASKNAKVTPSKQCCTNIANMGKGLLGAKCLCSLLSHPLAKSNGVVPRIALAIPQKCRIAVPKGFICQGIRVPGS